MARTTAREMLYRLMAAKMADNWRQVTHWTVRPGDRFSRRGRPGRRRSRSVKEARERGTDSSGRRFRRPDPALAARVGRWRLTRPRR